MKIIDDINKNCLIFIDKEISYGRLEDLDISFYCGSKNDNVIKRAKKKAELMKKFHKADQELKNIPDDYVDDGRYDTEEYDLDMIWEKVVKDDLGAGFSEDIPIVSFSRNLGRNEANINLTINDQHHSLKWNYLIG